MNIKKILIGGLSGILLTGLAIVAVYAASAVVYDNLPNPIPGNVPSVGYEATSTSEFGGQVQLADTNRNDPKITVLMSSWGCEGGTWWGGDCLTSGGATFTHPITLNVYNVAAGDAVGSLIVSKTDTFTMPYRPSADAVNCTEANAGKWSDDEGNCFNGYAFPISFDLTGSVLPDKVIVAVAYNTTHYGASPIGTSACSVTPQGCPYDSLNVGTNPSPTVGTALPSINDAYQNSTWAGAYCDGGIGGTGTFRLDASCWTGYLPSFKIEASLPPQPICHLEKKSSTNYHLITVDSDAAPAHLKHGDFSLGVSSTTDCSTVSNFTAKDSLYYNGPTNSAPLYGTGAISFTWDKVTGNVIAGYYNEVVPPTTGITYYNVVTTGSVAGSAVNLTFTRTVPNVYGPFNFVGTLSGKVLTGQLDGPYLFTATGN